MKKLFCIFVFIAIVCMSTIVSSANSAETTGTLTLDLTSDTQVKAIENLNQNAQFRPMCAKVVKITMGLEQFIGKATLSNQIILISLFHLAHTKFMSRNKENMQHGHITTITGATQSRLKKLLSSPLLLKTFLV
ncbi:MAG: hypothetical protein C5S52_00040 [ANME-2 cluster archaeon]|nr:hypothetical protein [ANME-2 cluster archaeon]